MKLGHLIASMLAAACSGHENHEDGTPDGMPAVASATVSVPRAASFYRRGNETYPEVIPAGTICEGSDGAWNCLTTSWQRCANGRWSMVLDTSAGTICTPPGISYDFHIVDSGDGGSRSASEPCECTSMPESPSTMATATPTPYPWITSSCTRSTPSTTQPTSTCTSSAATPASSNGLAGGEFVSGSTGIASGTTVVVAVVGTMALIFARLLM